MQNLTFPSGATPSALPTTIRLAIASSSARPPEGDDWLHEGRFEADRSAAGVGIARLFQAETSNIRYL